MLFDRLESIVLEAGAYAVEVQRRAESALKADGSFVTSADIEITERLCAFIGSEFPGAGIITEEDSSFSPSSDSWNFIIDPIDGTGNYRKGLGSWCIGVGVLDERRQPIASLVYAPSFLCYGKGLLIRTDPGSDIVLVNGVNAHIPCSSGGRKMEIAAGSSAFRWIQPLLDKATIRSYGSSLLHLSSLIAFPDTDGAIDPPCYIWDIAPIHAALIRCGMDYRYIDGSVFRYDDSLFLERRKFGMPIAAGRGSFFARLEEALG